MSVFRVPYLVGDKLGRDHQYWPVKDSPFVDEEQILSLTLDPLLKILWRVREWTVSAGTMTWTTENLTTESGSWGEFICRTKIAYGADADVLYEPQLLSSFLNAFVSPATTPTLRNAGLLGKTPIAPVPVVDPGEIMVSSFTTFRGFTSPIKYDSSRKKFAFPIEAFGTMYNPNGPFFAVIPQKAFNDLPVGGNREVVRASGRFEIVGLGGDISLPMAIGFRTGIFGIGDVSNITMTPVRWWKYRNSLGQEVYDELTGAVVNDPHA